MDMQSHILLWEDQTERSLARAKRGADRLERAYWRVYSILNRMNGPVDGPQYATPEAWRAHLDAYARVRDRLAYRWDDLQVARRQESEWMSELQDIRAELARIDELQEN